MASKQGEVCRYPDTDCVYEIRIIKGALPARAAI